jgi:hypothetical protein
MEKLHPALQMLPTDKKREPDAALRLLLIEALLLLCTTRGGRDTLRAAGTYEIVRAVHLEEQNEKVLLNRSCASDMPIIMLSGIGTY